MDSRTRESASDEWKEKVSRIVVTGGAGFLGSHLCDALVKRGDDVVCVDNLLTSDGSNIAHLLDRKRFAFTQSDVTNGIHVDGPVDAILHLASPASPPEYLRLPFETLAVGSRGTEVCLKLAQEKGARFILASTSEVYGEPLEHPQRETYWGNVNPIGPRSVYDEAKRFGEAITMAYGRYDSVDVGIVRIFNTYGPRLRAGDGRVVSNFIVQALANRPMTVYGNGAQTRSFCFVDDLVRGLLAMVGARGITGPVNLGNPVEMSVLELAVKVQEMTQSSSSLSFQESPQDDPTKRQPDVRLAKSVLQWAPTVDLVDGLGRTIEWFRLRLGTMT